MNVIANTDPCASVATWRSVASVASRVRYMLTPVDETTAARDVSKPLAANASGHDWPLSKSTGTKCRPSGSG